MSDDAFLPFVVFHDYGAYKGWKILGSFLTIRDAVDWREAAVRDDPGNTLIFEFIPTLEAYARAHIEQGAWMTNKPTKEEVLMAMRVYGGSFVQQLARTFQCADRNNQERLRIAFPDLFDKYRPIAVLKKASAQP